MFLYKKKIILVNTNKLKKNFINQLSIKNYCFLFVIYCFTWAPKTAITGDIGSLPLYRAIYKLFKILLFKDGAKYKKLERLIDGFS